VSRLGVSVPLFNALPPAEFGALAREVEARGYDTAWNAELAGPDAFTVQAVIASHTARIGLATGVVPIQTRTPMVLAMTAATLARLAPGRIALGVGVSSPTVVSQWNGLSYRRPRAHMREALVLLRRILAGDRVSFEGEFYTMKNFRLAAPPAEPVRLYVGALGPAMLELAGELADGVLLNWLAPDTVSASLRHLEAGARRAGRSLDGFEIAAFVRTCVTDEPEAARLALARDITGYVTVDSYARFFHDSGYGAEMDAARAAWGAGDRAGAVKQISPRMLEGLGVIGLADACRARVREFAGSGLTQPVIVPFSPDPDPRASLLRTIRTFP
jgi:probable F420-dependent oxidoreductase